MFDCKTQVSICFVFHHETYECPSTGVNIKQPAGSAAGFLPRLPRGEVQHAMHAIGDAAHSIAHKIRDDVHLADIQKTAGEVDEEK